MRKMKSRDRYYKEWSELLVLTRNDEWEGDLEKYNRVRKLAPLFGGSLLPRHPDSPAVYRIVVIVEPSGRVVEFSTLAEASDYLDYSVGNLKKIIIKGKLVKRGYLAGYYIYEKDQSEPLNKGVHRDEAV